MLSDKGWVDRRAEGLQTSPYSLKIHGEGAERFWFSPKLRCQTVLSEPVFPQCPALVSWQRGHCGQCVLGLRPGHPCV